MLEVCERFNMRINEYKALPAGERALYDAYAIIRREEEAKIPRLF